MDNTPIQETVTQWGDRLVELLPNFLLATAVFFLFVVVGRLIRSWVRRLGNKISDNKAVNNLLGTFVYIGILAVGLSITLKIMKLDGAATSILAGAGIAGVAIGFAFQDIAANFIAGVVLAIQRPFKIGDLVETNETFGTVRHVNLRSTEIETLDGKYVHIPNKDILLNPATDYSHKGSRRIDLSVGVAYDTDLELAEKTTLSAIKSLKGVEQKKPIDLYYEEFGDSAISFTVRFWAPFKKQPDYLRMRSEAIKAIKKEFDAKQITIPFPIRTLDISPLQASNIANAIRKN